jgi:DNA-binding LacI/PurR family transcriptional regulator
MIKGMQEIARISGVSISTVSRVLSGRTNVASKTRKRVQAVIERAGYEANAFASGLASRRTGNILLVVPNVTDDYYPIVIRHVSRLCIQRKYRVFLGVSDFDASAEREFLKETRRGSVDGLIVSSMQREENVPAFVDLAHRRFPTVHLDTECLGVRLPTVRYDDREGGRALVRHLVERGHRRILFCAANAHFQTVRDRVDGYREMLVEAGLPVEKRLTLLRDDGLTNWPFESLPPLFVGTAPPTALIAENDVMALACLRRFLSAGIRVPDGVAVAGFDDTYPRYLSEKRLTTVRLPVEDACRTALDMLFDQIGATEGRRASVKVRVLRPELVVGETT